MSVYKFVGPVANTLNTGQWASLVYGSHFMGLNHDGTIGNALVIPGYILLG